MRSGTDRLRERIKRENMTIRELYKSVAGGGGFHLIGTAAQISDTMEAWIDAEACDGFNITPTHLPGGCEDFVNLVIPELQRRGRFRTEYEGKTLRENLGLKPHINRHTRSRQLKAAE
jgi:alkanesulfonate monooxygenase SsuD/methylene tetrahydromethanopterin reductase-like flavin-dependent oxidoreductase (luciferase family)